MELFDRKIWDETKPADKGKSDCPLCNEDELCIWEGKYLKIIHNKFAMLGLKNHIMLIPKRHVILTSDLSDEELLEIRDAEKHIEKLFDGERYFSFIRQAVENRTLEHLHYQYLPGNIYYNTLKDMLKKQGY